MECEAGEIVPLVKVAIDSFKTKNGTFQKPVFTIDRWVPRPMEWSISVPVAAAPAAPQIAEAPAGGSFVGAPASPADDADLPFLITARWGRILFAPTLIRLRRRWCGAGR